MELYKLTYNLYNYFIKDNFNYLNTKSYINLWENTILISLLLLLIIFIYNFSKLKISDFGIIVIIIVFIYIYYIEIKGKIAAIENNKELRKYGQLYEIVNIIYNEIFDFSEDSPDNDEFKIKKFQDLLNKNNDYIEGSYLKIKVDNDNYLRDFFKDSSKIITSIENNIITIDNLNENYNYYNRTSIDEIIRISDKIKFKISNNSLSDEYNEFIKFTKDYPSKLSVVGTDITINFDGTTTTPFIYDNNKTYYITMTYESFNNNRDNYPFIRFLYDKLDNDINNYYNNLINNFYNSIIENSEIFIKINSSLLNNQDEIKNYKTLNIYIKDLILRINNINKDYYKFINNSIITSNKFLFNYLIAFINIKNKIKYNMKYENNLIDEEINDNYYNSIMKNNDLLKYVDINSKDISIIKDYLFINENKLNNISFDYDKYRSIITEIIIDNKKYYFINLASLNNNEELLLIFLNYINNNYETKYENLNILFENYDLRNNKKINGIIKSFNDSFIKLIIIVIIIMTIIFHIFYLELIRYIR